MKPTQLRVLNFGARLTHNPNRTQLYTSVKNERTFTVQIKPEQVNMLTILI